MGINEQYLSPVEKMSLKIRAGAEKERKTAQSAAAKKIKHARKIDHESEHYAKKYITPHAPATMPSSMALNPYEETRYIIPNVRDEMAPGAKPVDIGYDKDLESKDTTKQLKRRQAMKRFKQTMDEDAYDPGSSVPTPVNIMIPSIKIKPKKPKVDYDDVATNEEVDNEGGMAKNELETAERGIKNIKSKIKGPNAKLPAWVQSKISKASDHIDTVSDYMSGEHDPVSEGKIGLWDRIHAKRERIKRGSGERMRKPGSEGAPTAQDFKDSQVKEEGMFGDVSIGDKPTAYPNVSTPTPSVVARPQQRLKNKGAVNNTPYKEQEPS
jgi:hypothetical protein